MNWRILCLVILVAVVGVSDSAAAVPTADFAPLRVESVAPSVCVVGDHFMQGQQVRLLGSGFAVSTQVSIEFVSGEFEVTLGAPFSDSSGELDYITTVPSGYSAPTSGLFMANGSGPSGATVLTRLVDIGPASTTDQDTDGIPDFCDNCPSTINGTQEDGDSDGVGDSCDPCPLSNTNDADGDGLCGDVDACPFDASNDIDGDGVCGDVDNCPVDYNANQQDADFNGIGDACQINDSCGDGIDNDGDGLTDFPSDPGCSALSDSTETSQSLPCDDGIDNDADSKIDFRPDTTGDRGCGSPSSPTESPECDDGIDDDSDTRIDWNGVYGLYDMDYECGGDGSHDNELVPEPSVLLA